MPAPQRVSQEELISAIRRIAEDDGIDAVTMSSVASAVGVRTPSLYKRAPDRHGLLRLAADDAARELVAEMSAAPSAPGEVSADRLRRMARTLRAFAARAPRVSGLLFAAPSAAAGPSPEAGEPLLRPLLEAVSAAAPGDPLPAARTFTAWIYGFCTMEQAGAFRLGGNVDTAFEYGLDVLLGAMKHAPADA